VAVVAGTLHATAYPMTLLMPDLETTPMFAGAGMLMAAWGTRRRHLGARLRPHRSVAPPARPVLAA
jgi:hypothetical protein